MWEVFTFNMYYNFIYIYIVLFPGFPRLGFYLINFILTFYTMYSFDMVIFFWKLYSFDFFFPFEQLKSQEKTQGKQF